MIFFRYWLPLILCASIIFALSSIPGNGLPILPLEGISFLPTWFANNPDKIGHAILYGFFGWLSLRSIAMATKIKFPQTVLVAILMTAFYGATDEWHQSFVPLRSCDLMDWIADVIGASIAVVIFSRYYFRKRARQKN